MDCAPEDVFAVLSNGWAYATWVVGAARVRDVDETFPAPGSRIHHSVGAWPLLLSDSTTVDYVDPPHELRLRASAWPGGEAVVHLTCRAVGSSTEVEMFEQAVRGPGRLMPRPMQDAVLHFRNNEALMRLAFLAENAGRERARAS
jgi:uncharacterized protein YndB with AHSA1/START domain